MLHTILRWVVPLVLIVALALPAHAQATSKKDDTGATSSHVPVMEYLLAIGGTALILFVLCTPSRKR